MREIDRISDQLRRAAEGDAWHGPAVMELLTGVDAAQAARRVIPDVHSVWEILLHMTAWSRAVVGRLGGEPLELAVDQDWPPVHDVTDGAWQAAIADFRAAQDEVRAKLKSMSNDELGMPVPGKPYNNCFMLHGLVQHHIYHAGQIALLKKAGAQITATAA